MGVPVISPGKQPELDIVDRKLSGCFRRSGRVSLGPVGGTKSPDILRPNICLHYPSTYLISTFQIYEVWIKVGTNGALKSVREHCCLT